MKKILTQRIPLPLSFSVLLLAAACSKSGSNAAALPPDQIPTAMNQVFRQSSGETRELVDNCVSASQNKDVVAAFADLQQLSGRSDLTPEQRAVAARAMTTTFKELRAASETGNPTAKVVLHKYLSTR